MSNTVTAKDGWGQTFPRLDIEHSDDADSDCQGLFGFLALASMAAFSHGEKILTISLFRIGWIALDPSGTNEILSLSCISTTSM